MKKKSQKKELGITFRKHLIKKNPEKIGTLKQQLDTTRKSYDGK